jgi:hypothetical protein
MGEDPLMRAKQAARSDRLIVAVGILLSTARLITAADQPAGAVSLANDPSSDKSPILLMASANDSVRPTVSAGWPIVVEVRVLLKPESVNSLTLANAAGPWSDALRLECTDANNADRSSLFLPAYASEMNIELTRERSGLMVWILDAVDLRTLPLGPCRIRAVLDEKKVGGVVPAGLSSIPIAVTVASESANSSSGAAQKKCLAIMNAARWKQDTAQAYAAAEAHLATHPQDVAVLFLRGQIQRAHGQKAEAPLSAANENNPRAENFAIETVIRQLHRELSAR